MLIRLLEAVFSLLVMSLMVMVKGEREYEQERRILLILQERGRLSWLEYG